MTHKQKIIALLKEQEWVSTEALHEISWRYSARIHDLKRDGYRFLKKPHPFKKKIEMWKLAYTPEAKKEKVDLLKLTREEQLGFI